MPIRYEDAPEGLYDPVQDRMVVSLGSNHSSPQSVMASIHEANHAFLNASTTFGCAMLLGGSLVPRVGRKMVEHLARMLEVCTATHESYATVSGLASATGGVVGPELLEKYPRYLQYLARFRESFQFDSVFSIVVLGSCARAAMQTTIYDRILELPCEEWPNLRFSGFDNPDERFNRLMTPELVSSGITAVKRVWEQTATNGDAERAEGGLAEARETLGRAKSERVELLYRSAFDVFADELARLGAPRPSDEDQRKRLDTLVAKIQEFAGEDFHANFYLPTNSEQDAEAALANFRREVLVLRQEADAALFLEWDGIDEGLFDLFILRSNGQASVQLVSMPIEKLKFLYRFVRGVEVLEAQRHSIVTGLRRKFVDSSGERVDFLLITKEQLAAALQLRRDLLIVNIVSAVALYDGVWGEVWVDETQASIDRSLVLVDIDPFAFIEGLVESGGRIHYSVARVRSEEQGQPAEVNVFCFVFENDPRALYFSPCSAPYRDAIASFIERRGYPVTFDSQFMTEWQPLLSIGVSHVLREESRFGNHFWLTK